MNSEMKNQIPLSHAPTRVLLTFALMLSPINGYCDWLPSLSKQSELANHIKVVREVTLETGRGAPEPHSLAQTKDGNYVIAGELFQIPWATRTDSEGKAQWRYVVDMPEWKPGGNRGKYGGVAILPDNSTILCGNRELPPPPGKRVGDMVGILTHLDKSGQVLNHQILYPNGDKTYSLSYLEKCVPWGDGVAVTGHVSRFLKVGDKYLQEYSLWLIALNGKGDIRWEKLLPRAMNGDIAVMTNQDLLLLADFQGEKVSWLRGNIPTESTKWSNGSILFDNAGEIKWKRTGKPQLQIAHQKLVTPLAAESRVRLFLGSSQSQLASLRTLNEQGEDMASVQFQIRPLSPKQIYLMPNRDFVFFGTEFGAEGKDHPSAGITWLSADLKKSETVTVGQKANSAGIDDALPTGKPGEFVTVRHTFQISNQDKRQGVVLTFVEIK
jgi:hypothetical protein